jgi:hypothetical protein
LRENRYPRSQLLDYQAVRTILQILKKNTEKQEHPAFIYIEGKGGEKYLKKRLAINPQSVTMVVIQ